jgi:hypothetical protein
MKGTILFLGKENARWAFVKPVATVTDGIVDNYEGGWLQFAEEQPVGKEVNLSNRYLKGDFWLRKGE